MAEELEIGRSNYFPFSQDGDDFVTSSPYSSRKLPAFSLNSDYEADIRPHLRRRLYNYVTSNSSASQIACDHPSKWASSGFFSGENNVSETSTDSLFIRIISFLLIAEKETVCGKLLPAFVKWGTVFIALSSALLYIVNELLLHRELDGKKGTYSVLVGLRISTTLIIIIPNIMFRTELKKLMTNESSRDLLLTVKPNKYIAIATTFLVIQLIVVSCCGAFMTTIEFEKKNTTRFAVEMNTSLTAVRVFSSAITNTWNYVISIVCMMICSHFIREIGYFKKDLSSDRALCELKLASSPSSGIFANKHYRHLLVETGILKSGEKETLIKQVLEPGDIISRYYDLQIKLHAASKAFQKWFVTNITGIFLSVVEIFFSLLASGGPTTSTFTGLLMFAGPLLWVPILLKHVMKINVEAASLVQTIYPLEERLPIFQRFTQTPLVFHVYGVNLSRRSVGTFVIILTVGFIGRLWSLLKLN